MSTSHATPAELVRSLDAAAIRDRLAELTSEEQALRVLLRSAVARDRQRQRDATCRREAAE